MQSQLNANAGVAMTPTVKDEYVRNLDVVNIASQTDRQELEKRVERFKK